MELSEENPPRHPAPGLARFVVNGLRRRNILIGTAGRDGNVLKIRPPLCFSNENADLLVGNLRDVLRAAP
jgi:4-aminobutyrate aminotransferase-like enzyme